MSRCFPFPPPGYEKKARIDDPGLLKKEKQREKKHKKENRGKRENKEKKDKDGSDEKRREKKDKKEEHGEKKKDKDRDKDKEKNMSSDEKRLSRKSEDRDGEKTPNEKKCPGLNGKKFVPKEEEKDRDRNSKSGKKKVPMQFSGYSRHYSQNSYLDGDTKDSKFVKELGRRVGDEDRGIGNHLTEKFSTEQRRDQGIVKLVGRSTGNFEKGKQKKENERGVGCEARFSGNVLVRNLAVQTRVEGISKPLEKESGSRTELNERTKQKEGDDKHWDKGKYISGQKNEQGKDKERKNEDKAKMKSEHKNVGKDKLKLINKDDHTATHNNKTFHLPKDSNKNAISEGNIRKRKALETNGFCYANDIKPSKLAKPSSSSQSLTEGNKLPKSASLSPPSTEMNRLPRPTSSHSLLGNGRVLEPCQTLALCTLDKGEAGDNLMADSNDGKLNGAVESELLCVSVARPQLTAVQTDEISEVSMKPTHLDTKCLSQVLLVPKMEDTSKFDDWEEWLFNSSDSHPKMPKLESSGNNEMPQVWAEAVRIESADVCALPYVIPY